MSETRPRPRLELPVAFLKFWPDGTTNGADLVAAADRLPTIPGVARLGEGLLALWPTPARGDVLDIAIRLADALRRRAARGLATGASSLPAILIFPGRARVHAADAEAIPDVLFEDLEQRTASLETGTIAVTGYVATWLSGRYRFSGSGAFEGPSGRRVPLLTLDGERHDGEPWHNPSLFGRHADLPRPEFELGLVRAMAAPAVGVEGPLGVGKSYAVSRALDQRPAVWIDLQRGLPGIPQLTRSMLRRLQDIAPGIANNRDLVASELASLEPHEVAARLLRALGDTERSLGAQPVMVLEHPSQALPEDLKLVEALLQEIQLTATTAHGASRLILIDRGLSNGNGALFPELERLTAPLFDLEEMTQLSTKLLAGLEVPTTVASNLLEATAGHPLALEEGLIAMVHRGLLRRVYGSFFYAGPSEADYGPSLRLARHVEAAAGAVDEILPLRTLAAAEEQISADHLSSACQDFGINLPPGWQKPWEKTGWLTEEGGNLRFTCPAYAKALRSTLSADGARALRHSLGGVLAGGGAEWMAYRLMAGSPEALPSLLDTSRDNSETAPREEIFNALWQEHREHRERNGDESTELEILWVLLPLARRLGCLARLQRELSRAVLLARGDEQRYVALVALKAEHDQEQGNFRDAEIGLREALTASEGTEEKRRATLFLRLGALLHRQQRWAEARDVFLALASVAERGGESALGATCRFYLGNLALQQRRLDSAEAHQQQSLEYRLRHRLNKAAGTSLCALGAIAQARGDFPKALERFEEAERILDEAGATAWDVGFALFGSGKAMISLGDYSSGTARLKKSLESRQGRDDVVGEAITLLQLAQGRLLLGQDAKASEDARRAHFQLSLVPEGAFLGHAERLLGRLALLSGEPQEAAEHFKSALTLHRRYDDDHAVAEDSSWQLELAIQGEDENAVERTALELERLLDSLPQPDGGEALFYRLYRGLKWLRQRSIRVGDPEKPLRRAYKELMRKTAFLPAARRQPFLFQVRVHQDILNAATKYQISLPEVPQVLPPLD